MKNILFILLFFCNFFIFNPVLAEDACLVPIPQVTAVSTGYSEEELAITIYWMVDQKAMAKSEIENFGYKIVKKGPGGSAIIGVIEPSENLSLSEDDYYGFYYDDLVLSNDTYTYEVSIYDTMGNEYPAGSATVTAKIQNLDEKECKAELTLDGSADENSNVSLSWNEVCDADEYRVFRDNKQLGTTDKTEYSDQKVPEGKYKYKVEAWGPKTSSNSIKSNFLIAAAKADDKGKKAEGEKEIEVKKGGNNQGGGNGTSFGNTLPEYISNLYNWSIGVAAGLAVIMLIYAGYLYVTSAGNPESINLAKEIIVGAIAGFVLLVLAALILRAVMT